MNKAVDPEPVAWLVLSETTGNTRIWWRDKERAEEWSRQHNKPLIPLYADPRVGDILPLAAPPQETDSLPQTTREPTRAQIVQAFETIRLKLVNCLVEPERSAFWLAVQMRDALSRPEREATPTAPNDCLSMHHMTADELAFINATWQERALRAEAEVKRLQHMVNLFAH